MKTKLKIVFILIFLLAPLLVRAEQIGQIVNFFVDPSYDLKGRSQITASLQKIGFRSYFYLDENWWSNLDKSQQNEVQKALSFLADEFDQKIYPTLTSTFGSEWRPGIDNDYSITILIHPMQKEAGGYFNSADEYPIIQAPKSNQREMVYLNAQHIEGPNIKSLLSHEFLHLIIFNQKERIYGIAEEIWLNEARSEYAPTLLGYDDEFEGSNLQNRVKDFLSNPSDSLTEWKNEKADYGVLNLFTQYLVDHYGIKILVDSLQSAKIGIPSLNYALEKNGFEKDFSQIFTDWTITVLVNDCSLNEKYCYQNENLKNLRISPQTNFLPLIGESSLALTDKTKNWAGNWYKFIGGQGTLNLEFSGDSRVTFKVPYLTRDISGQYSVNFFQLDKNQNGKISIPNFRKEITSLVIIPSIQSKISDFSKSEPSFSFFWKVSIVEKTKEEREAELIKKLLAQIEELKKEIARLQAQINAILSQKIGTCTFSSNLYYGMMNNSEVRCLQEFLKSQGPEIYPEGLVTGNFLSLTKAAVIRFQEKYASEILAPWGITKGTGFVGETTRAKINQLLSY